MPKSRVTESPLQSTTEAYDLRIYDVADGELATLGRVMRELVLPMMPEYGITACGVWTDPSSNKLYQISKHASLQLIHENWERFHADPRWQTGLRKLRNDRLVVKGVQTILLSPLAGVPAPEGL